VEPWVEPESADASSVTFATMRGATATAAPITITGITTRTIPSRTTLPVFTAAARTKATHTSTAPPSVHARIRLSLSVAKPSSVATPATASQAILRLGVPLSERSCSAISGMASISSASWLGLTAHPERRRPYHTVTGPVPGPATLSATSSVLGTTAVSSIAAAAVRTRARRSRSSRKATMVTAVKVNAKVS
jgi:hypothetical protein